MRKTTTDKTTYNGPVLVEVTAETAEKALELAGGIAGLTLSDSFTPVPMEGGTFTLSGNATNVTDLPATVKLWPKQKHQTC